MFLSFLFPRRETDPKAEEKPKGTKPNQSLQCNEMSCRSDSDLCSIYFPGSFHNMGIFQAEHDRPKTDDPNDSDEFDHFYD